MQTVTIMYSADEKESGESDSFSRHLLRWPYNAPKCLLPAFCVHPLEGSQEIPFYSWWHGDLLCI